MLACRYRTVAVNLAKTSIHYMSMSIINIENRLGEQRVSDIKERRAEQKGIDSVQGLLKSLKNDIVRLTQCADNALEHVQNAYTAKEKFYGFADDIEKALGKTGRSDKKDGYQAHTIYRLLFRGEKRGVVSNISYATTELCLANMEEKEFLRTLCDRDNPDLLEVWRYWHPTDKPQALLAEMQETQKHKDQIVGYYGEIQKQLSLLNDAIKMYKIEHTDLLDIAREEVLPALRNDMHKVFPEDEIVLLADWGHRWHEIRSSAITSFALSN